MTDANPDEVVAALESAIETASEQVEKESPDQPQHVATGSDQRDWADTLATLTGEYGLLLETIDDVEHLD